MMRGSWIRPPCALERWQECDIPHNQSQEMLRRRMRHPTTLAPEGLPGPTRTDGYKPVFSSRVGACGTCKLRVVQGQAEPAGDMLSEAERSA
jgi:hypothetical protein